MRDYSNAPISGWTASNIPPARRRSVDSKPRDSAASCIIYFSYYHIYYWLFQMRHFQYFLHQLGESTLCTSTQRLRRWRWNSKTSSSKRVQRVKCELVTHTLFITFITFITLFNIKTRTTVVYLIVLTCSFFAFFFFSSFPQLIYFSYESTNYFYLVCRSLWKS